METNKIIYAIREIVLEYVNEAKSEYLEARKLEKIIEKHLHQEPAYEDSQPKEVDIKPYKVVTEGDDEGNTYGCTWRHCGKCKAHITYMNEKDCDKYCSRCGSKIKWVA